MLIIYWWDKWKTYIISATYFEIVVDERYPGRDNYNNFNHESFVFQYIFKIAIHLKYVVGSNEEHFQELPLCEHLI